MNLQPTKCNLFDDHDEKVIETQRLIERTSERKRKRVIHPTRSINLIIHMLVLFSFFEWSNNKNNNNQIKTILIKREHPSLNTGSYGLIILINPTPL